MQGWPRITIVTPSFNDERFLEETILSVLDQNYPNLEYIVIDGGSDDGSLDIIRKHESRISYWTSERDRGMYYAIQKGFLQSTGEIMGWINSDDKLHPGSLFSIGQIFRDNDMIKWIHGLPNTIDESGRIVHAVDRSDIDKFYFYKRSRNKRKYIQQESTFWRRELWDAAGGYISTDFKFASDFELWIRFFKHSELFHINTLLGGFRVSRAGQASIDHFQSYYEETNVILKKHPLSRGQRTKLKRLEFFEGLERFTVRFLRRVMKWFGLREKDISVTIFFDNSEQQFKCWRGQ